VRSNHLGHLDPHHLPALAWSPFSFLCAVTVARRRSRVVTMATPPPYWLTAVAWTSACTHVLPFLVQPRTHARARATTRAPAWRGQGRAFGSLSCLTSPALRSATGRRLTATGGPRPRLSMARPRVNSNPRCRPSYHHQELVSIAPSCSVGNFASRTGIRTRTSSGRRLAALFEPEPPRS
jgi:hypothetical protein